MNYKYKVELDQQERDEILEILTSSTASASIKKRANILLMSDISAGAPMKQTEIAIRCGTSDITVYHTLKDYYYNGIEYTLTFKRTKAPNPPIVTGDVEARIIALACGKAPEGYGRWTVRLLTERIVEMRILDTVSRETVRTTLKKHNLSLT